MPIRFCLADSKQKKPGKSTMNKTYDDINLGCKLTFQHNQLICICYTTNIKVFELKKGYKCFMNKQ